MMAAGAKNNLSATTGVAQQGRLEPDSEGQDAEMIAKAFGFEGADAVQEALSNSATMVDPRKLREALEAASPEDISSARDEAKNLLARASSFAPLICATFGEALGGFVESIRHPPWREGTSYVLLWLAWRRVPEWRQTFDGFALLADGVTAGRFTSQEAFSALTNSDEQQGG